MAKIKDRERIEAGNLMEDAAEIFESCVQCGMCKARCGVFRVLREEQFSPRGHGDLLSAKIMDKIEGLAGEVETVPGIGDPGKHGSKMDAFFAGDLYKKHIQDP